MTTPATGGGTELARIQHQLTCLTARLVARFGADIQWLGYGWDWALVGSEIGSWPGRIGGTLIYSPNSVGRYSRGLLNGKPCSYCAPSGISQKSLRYTTGAVPLKSLWAVSKMDSSIPGGSLNLIVPTTTNRGLIRGYYADLNWYSTGNPWTFYRDGIATNAIDAYTEHLYQCDYAASGDVGFSIGGYYGDIADREPYHLPITFGMALSVVPTEAQRIATAFDLMHSPIF